MVDIFTCFTLGKTSMTNFSCQNQSIKKISNVIWTKCRLKCNLETRIFKHVYHIKITLQDHTRLQKEHIMGITQITQIIQNHANNVKPHETTWTMWNHMKPRQQCETMPTMWNHVKAHKTTQNHAKPHEITQNQTKSCKTMQNHVQPCKTTQKHSKPCGTMPNHAKPSQTTHNYYWEHIESF